MPIRRKGRKHCDSADYARLINAEIVSCIDEQAWEGGEVAFWVFGTPTPVEDLLSNHDVPEDLWEDVASRLRCPKCDNSFSVFDEVGTKFDFQVYHESNIAEALKAYEIKLLDFNAFLNKAPTLGADHPVGRRILRELKDFPALPLVDERTWYQARKTLDHGFGRIPAEFARTGRYNSAGQSRLYLAGSPMGAVAEVCAFSQDRTAWVQEFRLPVDGKYLDLRSWEAEDDRFFDDDGEYEVPFSLLAVALIFSETLTNVPRQKGIHIPEYNIPRFVSDAAAKFGFSGIIYHAARHFEQNIVILDSSIDPIPSGQPQHVRLDETAAKYCDKGVLRIEGGVFLWD